MVVYGPQYPDRRLLPLEYNNQADMMNISPIIIECSRYPHRPDYYEPDNNVMRTMIENKS